MAQGLQLTTLEQRRMAYADAQRVSGGVRLAAVPCLSRAAWDWSRESHCGSDELRAFGLVGARAGWSR